MNITRRVPIKASAPDVWEVIAHQFDRIGEWASAVPASQPTGPPRDETAAPIGGRVCETTLPVAPQVEERIVGYDEKRRTLTYEAARGLPRFVTEARNRWQVIAIDNHHALVSFDATIKTRGVIGRLASIALRPQLGREGRRILADLEHYVEHGHPSARKQRQLNRRSRTPAASRHSRPAS